MHNRCKKNFKLKIAYHSGGPVSFTNNFKYPKIRPEGPKSFLGTEQNSSIIRVSEQNFEQNKPFLRAEFIQAYQAARKKKKKKKTSTAAGKFENPSRSEQSNRTDYPVFSSHKCDANFTKLH